MKKSSSFVKALTDILVAQKTISYDQASDFVNAFRASDDQEFDQFLLEEDFVSPAQLLRALADYYQVSSCDVTACFFEHRLMHMFPKEFLLEYQIIPLEDDESTLVMIAADPAQADLLPAIGDYVSYDIQFRVGLANDISDAINEFYDRALTEVDDADSDDPEVNDKERDEIEEMVTMPGYEDDTFDDNN